MAPPPSYVDITTAVSSRGSINVMGVVVDVFGDAYKTTSSALCITFTLKDTNLGNGHSWDGLRVKYFVSDRASLPPVKQNDVMLVQNIWVKTFNWKTMAVASQTSTAPWAIYRRESDAVTTASPISGPQPWEPSLLERNYALSLLKDISQVDVVGHLRAVETFHQGPQIVQQASVSSPKSFSTNQFSLIKDVKERTYVTLICEIVNIYLNDSEKVNIDVTDYTSNEGLFDFWKDDDNGTEGDPYNYIRRPKRKRNGPSGKMILRVTLWGAHAMHAREHVDSNQIVRLNNLHIKRSRVNGILEAGLHADRCNPSKVNIGKVDLGNDERVRVLIRRKKEYWAEHGQEALEEEEVEKPTNSKNSKKKQKKKRERGEYQEMNREEGQKPLEIVKRKRLNQNVQAMAQAVRSLPLERILSSEIHNIRSSEGIEYRLPFQNICYRPIVRVVDFFPPNLEDFAVPKVSTQTTQSGSEYDEEPIKDSKIFITWDWRFCLLIESATTLPPGQSKERMPVFVSGPDAVCLLRMDPVDLRKNKKDLKAMKERLFILWGDLEERKSKAATEGKTDPDSWGRVSSVPFACCIKEYGVRRSHNSNSDADDDVAVVVNHDSCSHEECIGWERRFAMFGTTINAR